MSDLKQDPMAEMLALMSRGARAVDAQANLPSTAYPFEIPETRAHMLAAIRDGASIVRVFRAVARVSQGTVATWRERALLGEEPFCSFFFECECAASEAVIEILNDVRSASRGAPDKDGIWKNQWQAGKFLLEHIAPEEYPRERAPTVQVNLQQQISTFDLSRLSDDELDAYEQLAAKAAGRATQEPAHLAKDAVQEEAITE